MRGLDQKIIFLFIVLVILTTISISVYVNKILIPTINNNKIIAEYEANKKSTENEVVEEEQTELSQEDLILELKSMSETDRIYKYFSQYINSVDLGEYQKAYGYLYSEFKQNYFPTQEDFENYVKETYPEYFGIEYEDIDRQGTYYILTVRIYDAIEQETTEYLEQKFVISENDFGNFVLSFQV